jgi:hypothetical protein
MGFEKYGNINVIFNKFPQFSGNIKGTVLGEYQK